MSHLELLLASNLLAKKQLKNIIKTEVLLEEETNKIYLLIEVKTGRKLKDGSFTTKLYKNDITESVFNHESLESFYKSLIVSEMIIAGYLLIPIQGGYLCVGGQEVYSLLDNTCTCPAYLNNKQTCKHLYYRDGLLEQRSRINNWKMENLK